MDGGRRSRSSSSRDKRTRPEASLNRKRLRLSDEGEDQTMVENGDLPESPGQASGSSFPAKLGHRQWVDRVELIRVIEQSLYGLGYGGVAKALEGESGILHEEEHVVEFREAVASGRWEAALALLGRLGIGSEDRLKHAKFLVLEQKYLEATERKDWRLALQYLRTELAPLKVNLARLHELAVCLMCKDLEDLKQTAQWDGIGGNSRRRVLLSLQSVVPADVMLAEDRLLTLLDQAIDSQLSKCLYHNTRDAMPSLLSDYACGEEQIPNHTLHMLLDHKDEVWHVQFSNDGKRLASCSKDGVTIIWEILDREHVTKVHELRGHVHGNEHRQAVHFLAWSPDDQLLATASRDKTVRIWVTTTGECRRKIDMSSGLDGEVQSIGWLPDCRRLVTGGMDSTLCMWNVDGEMLDRWSECGRVQDLVVSKDGSKLVCLGGKQERKIWIHDLNGVNVGTIENCGSGEKPSALALSNDGRNLLVATQSRQIQLWELEDDLTQPQPASPSIIYKAPGGEECQRFIIRTCFGGTDEAFVLSGSEECTVYVWHRRSGELLAELEGHSGTVNAVHWNPTDPYILASASDDKSVHIWGVSDDVVNGQAPRC